MSSPAIGLRTIVADILCDQCQTPLIEIDLYGERLSGCTVCNKWGLPGDNHRVHGIARAGPCGRQAARTAIEMSRDFLAPHKRRSPDGGVPGLLQFSRWPRNSFPPSEGLSMPNDPRTNRCAKNCARTESKKGSKYEDDMKKPRAGDRGF